MAQHLHTTIASLPRAIRTLWGLIKSNLQPILVASLIFAGAGWVINKIVFSIRTSFAATHNLLTATDAAFDDFTQPVHVSWHPLDMQISILAALIACAAYLTYLINRANHRRGEEHGSARFATKSMLARYTNPDPHLNLKFAVGASLSLDAHTTHRNLNSLVIGASGAGKTRNFVCPNIAQATTSFIITDPKGEIYRKTSSYLARKGYQIRQLNLVDFARSAHFNPLAYINPDQPEVSIMILVENFMTNTAGKKPASADSGFWEKAERALLSALCSYVVFTREQPTLGDVTALLAAMEASEQNEHQQSPVDVLFNEAAAIIRAWDTSHNNQETDNLIPQNITPDGQNQATYQFTDTATPLINGLRFAVSQYRTYLQGAGETKKSVIISLAVRLAPLHMSELHDLLSTDTLHLDQIGTEKTALYLIIPDTHATFSFLVSIIYEQLFETTIRIADTQPTGALPIPIQCFMDEFANIGKMPSFERKIAVMRSRGISVNIIIQNFGQGKALYKDDWETIVGNCDSLLFLGGTEKSTTEYVSKILGKQTIVADDHSLTKGRTGSYSTSTRLQARDLLTPDEIGRLPENLCLYILRGILPYKGAKLPYPTELAA